MNQEHFKSILNSKKDKLEKEIGGYLANDPYKSNLRTTEVLDDAITEIEEHDRLSATSEQLKEDLVQVNKALERIENGTFGICSSCNNKIQQERLEALPTVNNCLSCQKKQGSR